jgi:hypothetical protein
MWALRSVAAYRWALPGADLVIGFRSAIRLI